MKKILLFGGIVLAGLTARGDTWTYSQCVDYAREHNINLQKALVAQLTADYNLEEAKAQWQPSLDFGMSHSYVNSPWGENKNLYTSNYGFNAGWTVWNGGVRENNIRRAQLQTEIQALNSGNVLRTLETDLLQVYLNILYAKESIAIAEDAAQVSKAQAERGKYLMQAGRISRVEYARLNSQYEQDNYSVVNAQATYDNRRMELKQLLELGLDTDITLEDVEYTAAQILAALPDMEESYQLALDTDLRIKELMLNDDVASLDVKIAKAGHMPQIGLNAGVSTGYAAPGNSFGQGLKRGLNENIGISLSIPIFDNSKTKAAVSRAKAQQIDAQLDIEQRRIELAQAVENWFIDTRSAQARFEAAQTQVEAAKLAAELSDEQFAVGYVNPVELLTAHNALTEARYSLLQAKFMALLGRKMIDYYRTAQVKL